MAVANRRASSTGELRLPSTSAQASCTCSVRSAYTRSCGPGRLFPEMMLFGALYSLHPAKQLSGPSMVTTFRRVRSAGRHAFARTAAASCRFWTGQMAALAGLCAPAIPGFGLPGSPRLCRRRAASAQPLPLWQESADESPQAAVCQAQNHAPGQAGSPTAQLGSGHSMRMLYHQSDLQVADQIPPK